MRIIVSTFVLSMLLVFSSAAWSASPPLHSLRGEIAAIDLQHGTVVVEVPVEQGSLTVGGPVVPDAALQKNGKKVDLNAFSVGEEVQVAWEKTDETLLIHRLVAAK